MIRPAPFKQPEYQQPPAVQQPQAHLALYRRIATVFVVLTVGTVGLALYVIFSRATVVVLSRQDEVKTDFIVDVSRKPADGELAGDVVELTDSISQKFPSTSSDKVDVKAEGRVRIKSALGRAQTLVATTRLLTPDGVLFRIAKTVTVPANGSVEVDAAADQPGAGGAVGTATFTIPGLNPDTRKLFTVETVEPITGGVKEGRIVTQEDVDGAAAVLRDKLLKDLTDRVRQQAKDDKAPVSGEVITPSTVSQLTDVAVGGEAEEFTLTLKLKVDGVFFDKDQLGKMMAAKLKELVPFDRKFLAVADQATELNVEKLDVAAARANIRVTAKGSSIMSPDAPTLAPAKLAGVTVDAAKAYLEKVSGVSSASVKVSPFWSNRLPDIADHIRVEIR